VARVVQAASSLAAEPDKMSRRSEGTPVASPLACPSAPPEWEDAQLFGVVTGTVELPDIRFVGQHPVTPALLALAEPVTPTEVFRFTAKCREEACCHFAKGACGVVAAVVDTVSANDGWSLPKCGIRSRCRWWSEKGKAACRRCTLVVTDDAARPPALVQALKMGIGERVQA
jgi:hypothetical protein